MVDSFYIRLTSSSYRGLTLHVVRIYISILVPINITVFNSFLWKVLIKKLSKKYGKKFRGEKFPRV